jgi:hypothetical protein
MVLINNMDIKMLDLATLIDNATNCNKLYICCFIMISSKQRNYCRF